MTDRWSLVVHLFDDLVARPYVQRLDALRAANVADDVRREVISLLTALEEAEASPDAFARPAGPPRDRRIGAYTLLDVCAYTSDGVVYEAIGAKGDRVAMRMLLSDARSASLVRGIRTMRETLARLAHPHVAAVLDAGETPAGRPFVVSEFAAGRPILSHSTRHQLGLRDRVTLVLQLCDAVQHAHEHMVLIEALGADQVVVTTDGIVKLLEPGVAHVLRALRFAGSHNAGTVRYGLPRFVSPEYIAGGPLSAASDVFVLGTLLYELVSGSRPFRADGRLTAEISDLLDRISPPPPSNASTTAVATQFGTRRVNTLRDAIRGDLDAVTLKALARSPVDRYSTVSALRADLARWLQGVPVSARPPRWTARAQRLALRLTAWSLPVAAIGAGICLLRGGR